MVCHPYVVGYGCINLHEIYRIKYFFSNYSEYDYNILQYKSLHLLGINSLGITGERISINYDDNDFLLLVNCCNFDIVSDIPCRNLSYAEASKLSYFDTKQKNLMFELFNRTFFNSKKDSFFEFGLITEKEIL